MIHDTLRAALLIAVLAAAASIAVETRQRLAIIDLSARLVTHQQPQMVPQAAYQPIPQPEPGRLQRFGRATLDLADAALGVIR
jgi:Skp family chaperone for outer membrane proteins